MARSRSSKRSSQRRRLFSRRLGEVARLWRGVLDRELRTVDLSFMQWLTLSQLAEAGEDLVQKELAARVGIEGPAMVGILDRLVRESLVERRVSATDRRANTIHLTARGDERLGAAERGLAQVRDVLLAGIDEAELERTAALLEGIAERARTG